ncbi:hypothetical protein NX059_007132 [Plenodomus lindquistii]|nr:hypothetical protein NX059_007132 [Plenodomus lindquistii]
MHIPLSYLVTPTIWLTAAIASPCSPPQGQQIFTQNNGATIHYRKYGSGPYLILQHGFPDRETTFNDFQVGEFAKQYTVITPTLRGYPPSSISPNSSDYTTQNLASDLLTVLDNENATTATLVGHDVGGAVVQTFSLLHPSRVHALILMNTPPLPTFGTLLERDKDVQAYAEYTIPYFSYVPGNPKNISTITSGIRNATYRAETAAYLEASPIQGMLWFYNENYPAPPYGRNVSFDATYVQRVPSMLLWGTEDPYFSPRIIDGLQGWFGEGLRLVTVPGAGHWVYRDAWEKSNREIWSFLRTVGM